jgi:hypothetical protein
MLKVWTLIVKLKEQRLLKGGSKELGPLFSSFAS